MNFSKLVQIVLLFLISVILFSDVNAACYNDCEPLPDCAAMGYKLDSEIFCPDGAITCPFDSHYKWCKEYKCEDGRYSDNETLTGERGFRCDAVEYHKRQCYYCRCDPDPNECKWSNLNKGYGEISDGCCDGHFATCKSLCQDTVTVPEHAHGITESCTGCGEKKDIITSWECDEWYDRMVDKCYARPCPDGYSITAPDVDSCGKKNLGSKGWTWDSKDFSGENICGRCTPKSCLGDYSTAYPTVDSCGEKGEAGWDWEQSDQYAGDDVCGKCAMKQCPSGFTSGKASANDCGEHGDAGWQYEQSSTFNGDTACGKCTEKQCPDNSAVDVSKCGTKGGAGYTLGDHAGWNGENECKMCVPLTCEEGTATTEVGCGETGKKGWKLGETTGRYNGETACQKCMMLECPTDTQTAYSDPKKCGTNGAMDGWTSTGTESYHGNVQCYKCTAKQCPKDYNTNKPDEKSCGTPGGWDWTSDGYSGDKVCGKCTAKPCDGFNLLTCPEHGSCDTCQNGDTLKHKLKSCEHGWHAENDKCVEDLCEGYDLTQCPDHGTCTQCQKGATIMYRLDSCHNGWNKSNNTCVMNECKDYAPTAATCGNSTCGASGWTTSTSDTCQKGDTKTYKCVQSACPKDESTAYSDVEKCGTKGSKGWTNSQTSSCNGDVRCYKCTKRSCENGYETKYKSVDNCGTKGAAGWDYTQSNTFNGEDVCGKCTAKKCTYAAAPANAHCTSTCYAGDAEQCNAWDCDDGYQKKTDGTGCEVKPCDSGYAIAAANCGNGRGGYDLGTDGSKSGTNTCRKCVAKSCPNNEKTEYSDVKKCGTSGGWTSSATGNYAGDAQCYKCTANSCAQGYDINHPDVSSCGKKGSTGWDHATLGYAGDSVCGKCTKKNCPQDYSTTKPDENSCGTKGGWTWTSNGYSGEDVCGKCTAKSCPNDETTDNDVSKCGSTGADGWTKKATGNHAGNAACYKCEPKTCSPEVKAPTNGYCSKECTTGNNKICVEWLCNKGYTKANNACNVTQCPANSAISADKCGSGQHPTGWELGTTNGTWSGSSECKACVEKKCANGSNTSSNDINNCGYQGTVGASKKATGAYSGDNACYECQCNAPTDCKWKEGDQGTGTLSTRCCNGNYQGCKSNCVENKAPEHAKCTQNCTGCNQTVCTKWECVDGYKASGSTCIPATCPDGYDIKKQKKEDCGAASGWTVTFQGKSGETNCGKCVCTPDTKCKWNDSNKGNATLGDLCCNNMYATCHSTCEAATQIDNANCTKKCKGCDNDEVCVEWTCKSGYTKVNGSCVVSKCPQGSGTTLTDCGSHTSGWSLGNGTGVQSGNGECKTCVEVKCPDGQTTTDSASGCGQDGGWTRVLSGNYSGDNACYKCQEKACRDGTSTQYQSVNDCTSGSCAIYHSDGYSGNKKCGVCYYSYDVEMPAHATCAETSKCDKGTYCSKWKCVDGYKQSGSTCVPADCPVDFSTAKQKPTDCGTESGWTVEFSGKSGETQCGRCKCTSTCKWNNGNKGDGGNISGKCCDGNYATCTSTCGSGKTVPDNARCTSWCKGCDNAQVCTAWSCNSGYTSNGSSCVVAKCPEGSATSTSNCGTFANGWDLGTEITGYSGTTACHKCIERNCPDGEDKNSAATNCGTTGALGYVKNASGNHSGNSACYKCEERTCPTGYHTIYQSVEDCLGICSDYSFNGYAGESKCGKCTITPTVFVPKNASCTESVQCEKGTACKKWACDLGYKLDSAGTGCESGLVRCSYNCTLCGGAACSSSSTYNGCKCMIASVKPVDPDPTPTGCPTGYATQLSGCSSSTNCRLDKSNQSGTSNGSPCYKCSCVSSGGGTLLPDCPFDCRQCGGSKCSQVQKIGDCFCMAKLPVGDLVP